MPHHDQRSNCVDSQTWPELSYNEWKDTYATLHMWTQIVGKIRLMQSPHINHWWQVALYVTARGLTTSPIPYEQHTFQIDFDLIDHVLILRTSYGATRTFALTSLSVAGFYRELTLALNAVGIKVDIWTTPVEVPVRIPFEEDDTHASYVPEDAQGCWLIMVNTDRILNKFRSSFIGKCSPVHFFWGAFDMAVTRFSGRTAPQHPGGIPALADFVVREAYSHEVSSCGFWPGGGAVEEPAFYSYAYPEPVGFKDAPINPKGAFYQTEMAEFILPYEVVRKAENPEDALLNFLQNTYDAAANLGNWDRASLERQFTL